MIRISLRIRAVRPESLAGSFWIAKDSKFLHADNEDSDADAQADLNLCRMDMSECTFSDTAAQMKANI